MSQAWRMEKMCDNCPFARSGPSAYLKKTLRSGRWREILATLRKDGHFICHKTTRETGNGSNLMCAGAIEWQEAHGCVGQLQRIMERVEHAFGKGGAVSVRESFDANRREGEGEWLTILYHHRAGGRVAGYVGRASLRLIKLRRRSRTMTPPPIAIPSRRIFAVNISAPCLGRGLIPNGSGG
jgi:hypothetical protein